MDLIQIGTLGLIAGIDKYYGEYQVVYRSVIIGRIVGYYIENYSSTLIHFYPSDKRKIYKANKIRAKHVYSDLDHDEVLKEIMTVCFII